MDWLILVGDNIRRLRDERGVKQQALASESGIGARYLRAVEKGAGNPSLRTLIGICDALEVDPRDLFRGAKDKK